MSDTDVDPPVVDPRDDRLMPSWIWLTVCTIALICLLFISFRRTRARSIEWYQRAKEYLLSKLSAYAPGGIRLTDRDLEANPFDALRASSSSRRRPSPASDDASDASSVHSDADELPASSPSLQRYSFAPPASSAGKAGKLASSAVEQVQRGVGSVAASLGWGEDGRGPWASAGGAGEGGKEKSAGIAKAFWGLRAQDRTGGIKLGGESGTGGRSEPRSELSGVGGAISRIFDVAGAGRAGSGSRSGGGCTPAGGSGHHRSASASSATSGTALFDLGDDAELHDAVELPTHFSLSSGSASRSGGNSSGSSAKGASAMQ
ncbi:hypothetical protein JCM8097_009482 [Rhodosporidiobolus ruineniae]